MCLHKPNSHTQWVYNAIQLKTFSNPFWSTEVLNVTESVSDKSAGVDDLTTSVRQPDLILYDHRSAVIEEDAQI